MDAELVTGKTEMRDRLIGMMGTLGLALLLSVALPTAVAFATGHGRDPADCGGACGKAQPNGKCPPAGTIIGAPCAGGIDPEFCGCDDATADCGCRK